MQNSKHWRMVTKYPVFKNDPVPSLSQSGYKCQIDFATHYALSAGLVFLHWGNLLLSQMNHRATETQRLAGASGAWTSGSALSNSCSMQVQTDKILLGPDQARLDCVPGQRSHSFSGPLFQCLVILTGNIFFLRFH